MVRFENRGVFLLHRARVWLSNGADWPLRGAGAPRALPEGSGPAPSPGARSSEMRGTKGFGLVNGH